MKKLLYTLLFLCNVALIQGQTVTSFPYFENFENTSSASAVWTTSTNNPAGTQWELGTPQGFRIRFAASGSNAWVTNLFGDYSDNSSSALVSPSFDLTSLAKPYVSFYMIVQTESCCDDVQFQYSNNGTNWITVNQGSVSTNYSTRFAGRYTPFYLQTTTSLDNITVGANTQFRFLFTSDGSVIDEGIAIDDFFVGDLGANPRNDLEAVFLGYDNDTTNPCSNANLGVIFQNNSTSGISGNNVTLSYQVNNGTIVTESPRPNFPVISPQNNFNYRFVNQPSFGSDVIKAWINYASDVDNSNDTLSVNQLAGPTSGIDVQVSSIFTPSLSLGCRDSTAIVRVEISNLSNSSVVGFPVKYQVNNDPVVSETLSTPIPGVCSGGRVTFNFSTPISFQQTGTYSLKVWTDMPTDVNNNNDTVSANINYTGVLQLPFLETFESGILPSAANNFTSTFPPGWINISDDSDLITGDRNNANGPNFSYGGSGKSVALSSYRFFNTPLVSPCILIPNTNSDVNLELVYHAVANQPTTVDLALDVEDAQNGSIRTTRVPINVQTSRDQPFQKAIISIANDLKGKIVRLRLAYRYSGSAIDLTIDNVRVYESLGEDLAITSINSPLNFGCGSIQDSALNVSIFNSGTTGISSFDLCYQVNSDAPVCATASSGIIQAGQLISYTFPTKIDISTPGSYFITAYVNHSSDSTPSNDTVKSRFDNLTTPMPYREDFDSLLTMGLNSELNWQGDSSSFQGYFWDAIQGNTPSFSTGPSVDGSGSVDGVYLYTESQDQNVPNGAVAMIENINCFNLENVSNLVFEYDYHMYGASIGSLFLLAYTETDTVILDSIMGQQQTSNTESWKRRRISLDTISNSKQTRFAFMASRGNGDQSDIAIDNIIVQDSTTSIRSYENALNEISLYPNPANEYLTLRTKNASLSNKFVDIRIFSIRGQLMEHFELSDRNTILLNNYSNGVYLLEISSEGERIRKKFVVSR